MIYKAIVEMYIEVSDEASACDAIGEILREQTKSYDANSCLIDWGYLYPNYPGPVPATMDEISRLARD